MTDQKRDKNCSPVQSMDITPLVNQQLECPGAPVAKRVRRNDSGEEESCSPMELSDGTARRIEIKDSATAAVLVHEQRVAVVLAGDQGLRRPTKWGENLEFVLTRRLVNYLDITNPSLASHDGNKSRDACHRRWHDMVVLRSALLDRHYKEIDAGTRQPNDDVVFLTHMLPYIGNGVYEMRKYLRRIPDIQRGLAMVGAIVDSVCKRFDKGAPTQRTVDAWLAWAFHPPVYEQDPDESDEMDGTRPLIAGFQSFDPDAKSDKHDEVRPLWHATLVSDGYLPVPWRLENVDHKDHDALVSMGGDLLQLIPSDRVDFIGRNFYPLHPKFACEFRYLSEKHGTTPLPYSECDYHTREIKPFVFQSMLGQVLECLYWKLAAVHRRMTDEQPWLMVLFHAGFGQELVEGANQWQDLDPEILQ